jgi:acyl carrier protein
MTTEIEVDDRIKQVVANVFAVDVATVTEDASPDTVENWDSLGHMNLVVALEEEFHIQFSDEQMMEMLNLPLVVCVVKEQLAAR